MTVFQLVALPVIVLAAARTLFRILHREKSRSLPWATLIIWIAAGIAIGWPQFTSRIAAALGIGRGADLVFYAFCLAFLATALAVYNRFQRLESDLTTLVRHQTLKDAFARWPNESPPGPHV